MNRAVAWEMIRTAYKCSAELQSLLPPLQAGCAPDEYRDHARAIASAIATLNSYVVERAFRAHPELKQRVEGDIAHYGRLTD